MLVRMDTSLACRPVAGTLKYRFPIPAGGLSVLYHHGIVDGATVTHDMSVRHDESLEAQFLPANSIFVTVGPDPVSTNGAG